MKILVVVAALILGAIIWNMDFAPEDVPEQQPIEQKEETPSFSDSFDRTTAKNGLGAQWNEHGPAPPAAPQTVVPIVQIGDVEVPLKLFIVARAQPQHAHDRDAPGFFYPLEEAAAAGDDAAARALHEALQACVNMPKTVDELHAVESTARSQYATIGGVVEGEHVALEDVLDFWRRNFTRCQGVDPTMYERSLELLGESAGRGDWDNALLYAQALAKTSPEEGRARLEALAADGSAMAIRSLGQHSLAHKLASIHIDIAMLGADEKYLAELREIENSTSPPEFREAEQEAARLLTNPACCKL